MIRQKYNEQLGNYLEKLAQTKTRTNADRIRSMSDKELAIMLARSGKYFCHGNGYDPHSERCDYGYECEECWLDWLKQEAQ